MVLEVGDVFTVEGDYQRRTFWQWLTREPRVLQTYQVTDIVIAGIDAAIERDLFRVTTNLVRDFDARPDLMMNIGSAIQMRLPRKP